MCGKLFELKLKTLQRSKQAHTCTNKLLLQLVVLSSSEMNICMLYQARERILNLVQNISDTVPNMFEFYKNGQISVLIENLRTEAHNLLSMFFDCEVVPPKIISCSSEENIISEILLHINFQAGVNLKTTRNSLHRPATFGNFEGKCGLADELVDVQTTDVIFLFKFPSKIRKIFLR